MLSSNQPEVVETCLAASLLGAVVVPLNPRLVAAELRFQIDDAGVTHALVHPDLAPLGEASGSGRTTAWTIGTDLDARHRRCRATLVERAAPTVRRSVHPPLHVGDDRDAQGLPALAARAGWLRTPTWPSRSASAPDDVLLGLYPFFHVAGLGIVLAHLTVGARVVIPASADAEELWRLVGDEALTTISLPGLKHALVHPMADKVDRSSVRIVFGGAAMESLTTLDLLAEVLPDARVPRASTDPPRRATS